MHAVKQGTRITSQLLAFGRKQALRPETTDINLLIAGMDDMLSQSLRSDIRLEFAYGHGLWPVEIDQAQFQVALINLAVNARDAMPDGGIFSIETGNSSVRDGKSAEGVVVTITDTGQGMPPEVLSRAGEPFFSTKAEAGRGTGLGLAQVMGFVQQSGGFVEIKSEVRQGTTITLTFPRSVRAFVEAPPEPSVASAGPLPTGVAGEAAAILLVDDNLQVGELAAAVLSEAGYQVTRASEGEGALREFEQKPFSLVFSDLVMPGMSGLELARELRRRAPICPSCSRQAIPMPPRARSVRATR